MRRRQRPPMVDWRPPGPLAYAARSTAMRASGFVLVASLLHTGCMPQSSPPPKTTAPYGAWASPLTAARVTAGALRFGDLALDGDDVYWTEGRASEAGRYVIVRRTPDERTVDVTPAGFNVRSRVHEYRRRGDDRAQGRGLLRQLRRSAALPAAWRRPAGGAHAGRTQPPASRMSDREERMRHGGIVVSPGRRRTLL